MTISHLWLDRRHGSIRSWGTDAACYDGAQLPALIDKRYTASTVRADIAYRSQTNEIWLADNAVAAIGFLRCQHMR